MTTPPSLSPLPSTPAPSRGFPDDPSFHTPPNSPNSKKRKSSIANAGFDYEESPIKAILKTTPQRNQFLQKTASKIAKFKAPSSGCSGFTAFAEVPLEAFSPDRRQRLHLENQTSPLRSVMKWVRPPEAHNERLCAQILQAFNLQVPIVKMIPKDLAKGPAKKMQSIKPAFSPEPFVLMVMNRCKGFPLNDLCRSSQIFQIAPSEWPFLLEKFGEIAVIDLFLGNFDRLVRFDKKGDSYALADTASVNLGNILLDLSEEAPQTVKRIHLIDNSSLALDSPVSVFDALPTVEIGGLFGSNPPSFTASLSTETSQPAPFSVDALSQFFQRQIEEIQTNPEEFSHYVLTGLVRCVKEESPANETRQLPLMDIDAFVKGLHSGIALLHDLETHRKVEEILQATIIHTPLTEYLRSNLTWLKSRL